MRTSALRRLLRPQFYLRLSSTSAPKFYALFPRTLPQGPPPKGPFNVDIRALQKEFFALQQQSHPDVSTDASLPESSYINKAYTTLRDPLQRAQYLLSLRGIDVAGDERTIFEDDGERGGLLMEVMEANEQIDEAESEGDLEPLKKRNDERVAESVKALEEAFAKDDVEVATKETVRLRYWVNIGETLKHWEKR
jgi:molecular chaperone HscB